MPFPPEEKFYSYCIDFFFAGGADFSVTCISFPLARVTATALGVHCDDDACPLMLGGQIA
jgi:hypothetical protein